jgi:hypothetical protein
MAGGTVGESSANAAGTGIATLTAGTLFSTLSSADASALTARDGITLKAGSAVMLNALPGGGAGLAAGVALGANGTQTVTNSAAPITIEGISQTTGGSTTTSAPTITVDSGILATGALTIGPNANSRVASLSATGPLQSGTSAASADAGITVYSAGNVAIGPVLLSSQGQLLIDTHTVAGETAANPPTVNLSTPVAGFTGSNGIGRLEIDSDGAVTLDGVNSNADISIKTYSPGASITNGSAPLTASTNILLTPDGGGVQFATPSSGNVSLQTSNGHIDIEGAGTVNIPGALSAGDYLNIGATSPVGSVALGPVLTNTTGTTNPNTIAASGNVTVGPWVAGVPVVNGGYQTGVNAGGVSLSGSSVTTDGIVGAGTYEYLVTCVPGNSCTQLPEPAGVPFINITNASLITVNGPLVVDGTSSSQNGLNLGALAGGTVNIQSTLINRNPNGYIQVGDGQSDATSLPSGAHVEIDLSANVYSGGGDITFNGDVTLFKNLTSSYTTAMASSLFLSATGLPGNTSSFPPDTFYNHITDALTDPTFTNILAGPLESVAGAPPTAPTASASNLQAWLAYFGSLSATVSAERYPPPNPVSGQPPSYPAGNVTFNGALTTNMPTSPAAPSTAVNPIYTTQSCSAQPCSNINEIALEPTFVNVSLTVSGNTITFNGPTGETAAQAGYTAGGSSALQAPVSGQIADAIGINAYSNGMPVLGSFSINAVGVSVVCGAQCANPPQGATYYLFDPSFAPSSDGQGTSPLYANWSTPTNAAIVFQPMYFLFDNGETGNQGIGVNSGTNNGFDPGNAVNVTTSGPVFGNSQNISGGSGSSIGATSGANGSGGVELLPGTGITITGVNEPVTPTDPDITTDANRRTPSPGEALTKDACAQGAGHTADLGQSPGVAGAARNVFALCAKKRGGSPAQL